NIKEDEQRAIKEESTLHSRILPTSDLSGELRVDGDVVGITVQGFQNRQETLVVYSQCDPRQKMHRRR
ncbi:MAG: hypothetical protein QGI09_10855, partial [Dehalococcoidia bacterium]|nr:hypothetical protein [Dehalococcoidia bacterium]